MVKAIINSRLQKEFKRNINQLVKDFSNQVVIINPSTIVDCPNCFEAGTLVEVPGGVKSIDSFSVGDSVYNGNGEESKVTHVFCRHVDTEFTTIKTHGNNVGVTATSNHKLPVYTNEGTLYNPVIGDLVEKEIKDILPGDIVSKGLLSLPKKGLEIIYPNWDVNKYGPKKLLPDYLEINDEFLFAIGLFIAEGCTSKRRQVQYCLNKNEIETGIRVCEYWKSLLDVNYSIQERKDSENAVFEIYSSHLARFLDSFCGHLAENKIVPSELYGTLDKQQTIKLIDGYYAGDGHKEIYGSFIAGTISEKLAYQLYSLLLSCGVYASILSSEGGIGNDGIFRQDSYYVRYFVNKELRGTILTDDRYYTVVKSVEKNIKHTDVYNIEVSGVHTYIASGISVNNCLWDDNTGKSAGLFDSSFVAPVTIFTGTDSEQTITPKSFTNYLCPVCYGEGKLEATDTTTIRASIDFYPEELRSKGEEYEVLPYGKDGKSYIIFKAHERYYDLILHCLAITINGVRYEKVRPPVYDGVGINALVICWFVQVDTDARVE